MSDELLIRVLTRLLRVHNEFGERAFLDAANRSLLAIATSVQVEADRRAGIKSPKGQGVVPFPLATTAKPAKDGYDK